MFLQPLNCERFKRLYPTGKKPGVFNGSAKVLKLKKRERLKKLALRGIDSNTGTATYNRVYQKIG